MTMSASHFLEKKINLLDDDFCHFLLAFVILGLSNIPNIAISLKQYHYTKLNPFNGNQSFAVLELKNMMTQDDDRSYFYIVKWCEDTTS